MKEMAAAGGDAALKRLSRHQSVINFLGRCKRTMGFVMRNSILPEDLEGYLKQQIEDLERYLEEEERG